MNESSTGPLSASAILDGFSKEKKKYYDIKRDPSMITALNGQLTLTPELVDDLLWFYDIGPEDILSYVKSVLDSTLFKEEVDIIVGMCRPLLSRKESMWSMAITASKDRGNVLSTVYFSSKPFENIPKSYCFPKYDDSLEAEKSEQK